MLTLSVSALRDRLHTCLAVDRWAEEVAAGAPYVEAGALLLRDIALLRLAALLDAGAV
ncbi:MULTISPECIES: hypothetical protein [Cryobacterium]|nr:MULTISPECIES: hypothetical protein [Cryobacterium]